MANVSYQARKALPSGSLTAEYGRPSSSLLENEESMRARPNGGDGSSLVLETVLPVAELASGIARSELGATAPEHPR